LPVLESRSAIPEIDEAGCCVDEDNDYEVLDILDQLRPAIAKAEGKEHA
jgi:hypothetical protein